MRGRFEAAQRAFEDALCAIENGGNLSIRLNAVNDIARMVEDRELRDEVIGPRMGEMQQFLISVVFDHSDEIVEVGCIIITQLAESFRMAFATVAAAVLPGLFRLLPYQGAKTAILTIGRCCPSDRVSQILTDRSHSYNQTIQTTASEAIDSILVTSKKTTPKKESIKKSLFEPTEIPDEDKLDLEGIKFIVSDPRRVYAEAQSIAETLTEAITSSDHQLLRDGMNLLTIVLPTIGNFICPYLKDIYRVLFRLLDRSSENYKKPARKVLGLSLTTLIQDQLSRNALEFRQQSSRSF